MKRLLTLAMFSTLSFVGISHASSPALNQAALQPAPLTTVKTALTLKDDTKISVKGYIVKANGDEKYQFRDATGTIVVEIDDDLWQGKPIHAKTAVTLMGEVDVDYKPNKQVSIDVDRVQF